MKSSLSSTLCVGLLLASFGTASAQNISSDYTGPETGNWNTAGNWTPAMVPNNDGTNTYDVTIGNDEVTLDIDATVNSLTFTGDTPVGSFNLTAQDQNFTAGTTAFGGVGQLIAVADQTDVTVNLGNLTDFEDDTLSFNIYNLGGIASPGRTATIQFNGAHVVTNNAGVIFGGPGTTRFVDEAGRDAFRDFAHNLYGFFAVTADGSFTSANSMVNEGYFQIIDGGTLTFAQNLTLIGDLRDPDAPAGFLQVLNFNDQTPARFVVNGQLTNYDAPTKTLHRGRYNFECGGSQIGTLQVKGGALFDIVNNDASILLSGPGTDLLDANGASALRNLAISHRFRVVNRDFTTLGGLTLSNSDLATLSVRHNSHFAIAGDFTLPAGNFTVSPYSEHPTDTPRSATLTVNGSLKLAANTTTRFEVFDSNATGTATVTGNAALGGNLEILLTADAPITKSGGSLTLLTTAGKVSGSFANVLSGGRVLAYAMTSLNDTFANYDGVIAGTFRADYSNNSLVISDFQLASTLPNISTRLNVQPGDNAGIGGFIVSGIAPKSVLIRGIGPSLASNGLKGALQDPTLELHDATGAIIATNDDWQDSQADDIAATGIAPTGAKESAIRASLDPGSYTAILRGKNGTSGIGLVEIYDLDAQPSGAEFANLSTRGRVETGDNAMIGGTIVGPGGPATLVVRALGPSLASKGVPNPLQDPTLELRDSSGALVAQNDNWLIDNPTRPLQFENEGLAPNDFRESALQLTLAPGNYTAIVRGTNDTQGVALVEFYKLN